MVSGWMSEVVCWLRCFVVCRYSEGWVFGVFWGIHTLSHYRTIIYCHIHLVSIPVCYNVSKYWILNQKWPDYFVLAAWAWISLNWFDLIWFDSIRFELIWFDFIWFDLIWLDWRKRQDGRIALGYIKSSHIAFSKRQFLVSTSDIRRSQPV